MREMAGSRCNTGITETQPRHHEEDREDRAELGIGFAESDRAVPNAP